MGSSSFICSHAHINMTRGRVSTGMIELCKKGAHVKGEIGQLSEKEKVSSVSVSLQKSNT